MLHDLKYSPSFDHNKDWDTCDILYYALARVWVGVFSLSDPVAAEDDAILSARDREEEEVTPRKIICDRECSASRSTIVCF